MYILQRKNHFGWYQQKGKITSVLICFSQENLKVLKFKQESSMRYLCMHRRHRCGSPSNEKRTVSFNSLTVCSIEGLMYLPYFTTPSRQYKDNHKCLLNIVTAFAPSFLSNDLSTLFKFPFNQKKSVWLFQKIRVIIYKKYYNCMIKTSNFSKHIWTMSSANTTFNNQPSTFFFLYRFQQLFWFYSNGTASFPL